MPHNWKFFITDTPALSNNNNYDGNQYLFFYFINGKIPPHNLMIGFLALI